MRNRWLLLGMVCGMFFTAACSDDTMPIKYDTGSTDFDVAEAGVDMAVDMAVVDMGVETAPDMSVDTAVQDTGADMAPPDAAADMATSDATTDATTGDVTTSDATTSDATTSDATTSDATPAKPQVLFSTTTTSTTKYSWATVALDGTGFQVMSSPKDMDLCNLSVPGVRGPVDVRRDLPQRVFWGNASSSDGEDFIDLPGGMGRMVRWYDGTDYGLAIIKSNGTFTVLVNKGADTSSCSSTYRVQISDDGKLGAAVLNDKNIVLLKLDGTTWTGTSPASPVLDITPTGATFTSASFSSLAMGATQLLFVTADASSNKELWSAPLDGSAKAAKITLPTVGGVAPIYLSTPLTMSADGKVFATTAGASSSKEDLIIIKGTTATNLTKFNENLHGTGFTLADESSPRIALSAAGTYVVYATTSSASSANAKKAWVAKTDGTSTTEISTATNFVRGSSSVDVDTYGSNIWTDDDNLLFWAGTSNTKVDLFRFKASSSTLTALTKTGTATVAPWAAGVWEVDGAWINAAGTYVYYVAGKSGEMNIIGVNTTTFAKVDITTGLNINSESSLDDDMEGHASSKYVWFVAKKASASVALEDLYLFDQNAGTAASLKNLTNHSGTSAISITNLSISPDGTYASYTTGTGSSAKLWAVPASGTPVALNSTGSYVEPAYTWTADSKGIVYGGGSTSSSTLDLKLVTVPGAVTTTLHAAQSYLFVAAAGQPTP
jgi:hypothetical protein